MPVSSPGSGSHASPTSTSSSSSSAHATGASTTASNMAVVAPQTLYVTSLGNIVHGLEGEETGSRVGGANQTNNATSFTQVRRRKGHLITEEDVHGNVVRVSRAPATKKRRRFQAGQGDMLMATDSTREEEDEEGEDERRRKASQGHDPPPASFTYPPQYPQQQPAFSNGQQHQPHCAQQQNEEHHQHQHYHHHHQQQQQQQQQQHNHDLLLQQQQQQQCDDQQRQQDSRYQQYHFEQQQQQQQQEHDHHHHYHQQQQQQQQYQHGRQEQQQQYYQPAGEDEGDTEMEIDASASAALAPETSTMSMPPPPPSLPSPPRAALSAHRTLPPPPPDDTTSSSSSSSSSPSSSSLSSSSLTHPPGTMPRHPETQAQAAAAAAAEAAKPVTASYTSISAQVGANSVAVCRTSLPSLSMVPPPPPDRSIRIEVVIDAANVGMHDAPETSSTSQERAPLNSRIDAYRIAAAIDYFHHRNVGVAAFIPAYVLRRKGPAASASASAGGSGSENIMMQTETQEVLQALVDSRRLATVPPNDNDDLYILEFARRKNALVVSNDCFRDHCARDRSLRPFVTQNRLSYTFFNQDFMPNPAHAWVKQLNERLRAREGAEVE